VKKFLKNLKLNETNVSMLLGIVVVVIVAGLLVNYFRSVNKSPEISSTNTNIPSDQIASQAGTPKLENLPSAYTLKKGDTLWSIAEAVYGSGYNWMDIYTANQTALGNNPDNLNEGTKITIPKVEVKQLTSQTQPTPTTIIRPTVTPTAELPSGNFEYTVIKGDNLWNILEGKCNNGYLWPQVAKANKISNANHIEVGQKLTVSCK
jgi:nucleoid-associated protein YgaU